MIYKAHICEAAAGAGAGQTRLAFSAMHALATGNSTVFAVVLSARTPLCLAGPTHRGAAHPHTSVGISWREGMQAVMAAAFADCSPSLTSCGLLQKPLLLLTWCTPLTPRSFPLSALNTGVGISGQEGIQAVMAANFTDCFPFQREISCGPLLLLTLCTSYTMLSHSLCSTQVWASAGRRACRL